MAQKGWHIWRVHGRDERIFGNYVRPLLVAVNGTFRSAGFGGN
jgi:hypothetical protein